MQQLRAQTTTAREIFRLPLSTDVAFALLYEAYKIEVENRGRIFFGDETTAANIREAAELLTDNTSPKWGLMLSGLYGNGKTTFVRALKNVIQRLSANGYFKQQQGLRILSAVDVVAIATQDREGFTVIANVPNLAIDDLGREPLESSRYGNFAKPINDLLEHRYDKQLFTVITTNLTDSDIRPRYGDRIADRFREMMHVIAFRHDSYRNE